MKRSIGIVEMGVNIRSVRLERNYTRKHNEATAETPEKCFLPAFILVLLAGFDTKQPAARRVVLRAVTTLSSNRACECPQSVPVKYISSARSDITGAVPFYVPTCFLIQQL